MSKPAPPRSQAPATTTGASWNSTSTCACSASAGRIGDRHVQRLADDRGRGRPVDAEPGDAGGDVLDHHVLGDDELLEAGGDGRPRHRRHVEQQRLARGQDPQVADHPALRRQIGGVAALAGLQGGDVVGDQALQPGHPIRPGQAQPALPRSIHDDRARACGVIPRHGAHHRMLDSMIRALFAARASCDGLRARAPRRRRPRTPPSTSSGRASAIGIETVTVLVTDDGWKVTTTGTIAAPVALNTRLAEVTYDKRLASADAGRRRASSRARRRRSRRRSPARRRPTTSSRKSASSRRPTPSTRRRS